MKISKRTFFIFLLGGVVLLSTPSCKTGEGCEATEHYQAKAEEGQPLSTKRGKSNLFSKKQRKKMKKRR